MNTTHSRLLLPIIFFSGGATLVVEIFGGRFLAPFFGSTIFTWAGILIASLFGLAIGYAAGGKLSAKPDPFRIVGPCIASLGVIIALLPLVAPGIVGACADLFGRVWGPLCSALLLFSVPLFGGGILTPLAVAELSRNRTPGSASGTVAVWGTIGSLLIPLIAVFLLPSSIPTAYLFFTMGAVLFLLGCILMEWRVIFLLAVIAMTATMAFIYLSSTPSSSVATLRGFYGSLRVIETNNIRCLMSGFAPQGCITLTKKDAPEFLDASPLLSLTPNLSVDPKILILGWGTGSLFPKLPKTESLTVVDIDPNMFHLTNDYFFTPPPNAIKIVDDARHAVRMLAANKQVFDIILLDAFLGDSPPIHLTTAEFFSEIKTIISPRGALLINAGIYRARPTPDDTFIASLIAGVAQSFSSIDTRWNPAISHNLILAASNDPAIRTSNTLTITPSKPPSDSSAILDRVTISRPSFIKDYRLMFPLSLLDF